MASLSSIIDSMLKEYFIFRGFTMTLKAFENEIKTDKDKSFRVEKIVEQFQTMITNYDLSGLRHYWSHLDRRFFSKLSHETYRNINKLETSLLRLYLVHAIQNSKQEKVIEFFEKCTSDLQNISAWKDWFSIPFLKYPEQNPVFSIYFTRVWQESVIVALYNSLPAILNFEKDKEKLQRMNEENKELRMEIVELQEEIVTLRKEKTIGKKSIAIQTNNVSIGEECDYLVVNTKTITPKQPSTPPVKKSRWKKAAKEKTTPKNKQDDVNLKKNKKKFAFDKSDFNQELVSIKSEDVSETPQKRVIKSDVDGSNSKVLSPFKDDSIEQNMALQQNMNQLSLDSGGDGTDAILKGSVDHFTDENRKPFIILSQDDYCEHLSPVVNCRFSPDGRLVGSIDIEGIIKLWQCHPTPATVATVTSKPSALSFGWVPKHEGKLLHGNLNGKVSLYDVSSRKSVCEASVDSKYQRLVALESSPNGTSFMCSASSGIRKRAESLNIGPAKPLLKRQQQLTKLQSLTDSNMPSSEGTIFQWDLKTFKEQTELPLDPYPACIHCMSYNHNGTLLVTGAADGMIRLFDMRTCDCLVGWHAHSTDVVDVQFSVDETSLYSLGADGKLCLWDVHKVSFKTAQFTLHNSCIGLRSQLEDNAAATYPGLEYAPTGRLFAFDSDGKYMTTCAANGALMYYTDSKQSLEEVMRIPGQRTLVTTLDWNSSPNCSICVTGQANGIINVSSLLRR
eukprot:gene5508-6193_t